MKSLLIFLFFVVLSFALIAGVAEARSKSAITAADLQQVVANVGDHQADANAIISLATSGSFKGVTWNRLANFTDDVGNRLCGSESLEYAVNVTVNLLKAEGFDNVHAEEVTLPSWSRGEEHAILMSPRARPYRMQILGLGGSVGTPPSGITAEVIVVHSFDELTRRASEAKGKIVVFNQYCNWTAAPTGCYGNSVQYRTGGADAASAVGAVAALVRSVTPYSLYTPHTGMMNYGSNPKIPTASLTVEDAELLQRFSDRGKRMVIELYMEAQSLPNSIGHNVVAEITGSLYPDEVVLVSGHLDSWDVGSGVMDDGGGAFISWSVLSLIRLANLKPKRTVRLVMWSCEEFGGIGAQQYYTAHSSEAKNMDIVFESDLGVFKPLGLELTANANATTIVTAIGQLLSAINTTAVVGGGEGTDIDPWMNVGVPGASLYNQDQTYFNYHHTNADSMLVLKTEDLDAAAATWTVFAYVIADLDSFLPR